MRGGKRSILPWVLVVVSLIGFSVSIYLTLMHFQGVVPRCYVVKGCDVVQTSRYSTVLGVPIALAGAVFFAIMFYLGIGLTAGRHVWLIRTYRVLAYLGALAAIPLFLLQAVILKAFCTYCLVTEVVLVVTWVMTFALHGAPAEVGSSASKPKRGKPGQ